MARILVVDDDVQVSTLLQKTLSRAGFDVTLADNGNTATQIIRKEPVDLVITDIIMPDKEGLETIREIKRDFPRIKIIAMSGGGRIGPASYLSMAEKFGAQLTLEKPIDIVFLIQAVQNLLGSVPAH